MSRLTAAIILTFLASVIALAQSPVRPAFVEDFLDLPAPRGDRPIGSFGRTEVAVDVSDPDAIPPDDAPIEELVRFWSQVNANYLPLRYSPKPSAATAARLLQFVMKTSSVSLFSQKSSRSITETIRLAQDFLEISDDPLGYVLAHKLEIEEWLMFNSTSGTDKLVKAAEKVSR